MIFGIANNRYRMNEIKECGVPTDPGFHGPLGAYGGYTEEIASNKELDFKVITAEKYK